MTWLTWRPGAGGEGLGACCVAGPSEALSHRAASCPYHGSRADLPWREKGAEREEEGREGELRMRRLRQLGHAHPLTIHLSSSSWRAADCPSGSPASPYRPPCRPSPCGDPSHGRPGRTNASPCGRSCCATSRHSRSSRDETCPCSSLSRSPRRCPP